MSSISANRHRACFLKISVAGVVLVAAPWFLAPTPRFIWNVTASAPVGLYWLTKAEVTRGSLVVAIPPDSVRDLTVQRGYLPAGVPLVKHVAGLSGDQICAVNGTILVNGSLAAHRLTNDSRGRPMPLWTGCHVLADEVFLLMADVPTSFDGRYFGPVPTASIIGTVRPLWTY
ncbi:MAG: conjugative transfer signal peptidase TraF [Rhodospirillaceae bacterium]|nr:conjugative transfer signal peptidase TraF [Rhodospirillaceae bacterium]